jgi:phosphoglycerol transferase MdoB-like AlkP superfamily enzyme
MISFSSNFIFFASQRNIVKSDHFFKGLSYRHNIYVALALQLGLCMLMFTICRIGFYLFNASFFPEMTFGNFLRLETGGIRFDLSAVLYLNALFILLMILPFNFRFNFYYRQILKYLFLIINSLALATNVADFIYYRFTLRRTTADVFQQFENEQHMGTLWFRFVIDYWYALVFWIVLVAVMAFLYSKIKFDGPQLKNKVSYYASGVFALLVIAGLVVVGMRGGIRESTRPITLSNAGEYVKDPKEISIVLNTPFAVMRTLGKTKVQAANYFTQQEVDSIFTPLHELHDTTAFKKDNVVVIILESFSKEFFGAYNRHKENGAYKGYTPFLDSLIQHSKTFEYSFANGRKSIDGLPSVVSSIPAIGVPYFLSPYSGNSINSLASLLKTKGYHSSFFHGAPNGSMGFQAFMNIAGFENYYGKTEYDESRSGNDDFDGVWGIWDEKFLQFYGEKLNEFPQPFVSSFFSVSSHHPFKVPEEYEGTFKGGSLPIQKCVQYTDHSLKKFFDQVSKMPWFRNTLFVITADHTSSDIYFDESRTAWGYYSVPVIFYHPDNSLADMSPDIAQQIDIMPSVLGHLHFDQPYIAFGRDVFRETVEPFAFNYNEVYQLIKGEHILQFDGTQTISLYNYRKDPLLRSNLREEQPEIRRSMEIYIKAVIQQYNNRMIEDKLSIRDSKQIR